MKRYEYPQGTLTVLYFPEHRMFAMHFLNSQTAQEICNHFALDQAPRVSEFYIQNGRLDVAEGLLQECQLLNQPAEVWH